MTAFELARLRALSAAPTGDPSALERAAGLIGRTPQRAGTTVVLARHADAPTAADLEVATTQLPDSALVALGLCVGLAWSDRDVHPHPGSPFTFGDITGAARAMKIGEAAGRHLIGAVRHVLAQARLLEVDGEIVRLGPLIAAWGEADIEVFRRNLDALPEPAQAVS